MPDDSPRWPVYYAPSDTTGEKAYEEFYVPGEQIDESRFSGLGVIGESPRRSRGEVNAFLDRLEILFSDPTFTKADVVSELKAFLPSFEHEEKGRNLDQKM